jgi:hypothetical protein
MIIRLQRYAKCVKSAKKHRIFVGGNKNAVGIGGLFSCFYQYARRFCLCKSVGYFVVLRLYRC